MCRRWRDLVVDGDGEDQANSTSINVPWVVNANKKARPRDRGLENHSDLDQHGSLRRDEDNIDQI